MVLHILLIILKIIGIIIAVILGLLLLLLVTFLCVPVRYRLDASMPGEIKESSAYGRVTWLLRLIRIDVSFEEQELKWRVLLQPTVQRSFVVKEYVKDNRNIINNIKIATSIDSGILVKIDDQIYRGSAGSASEA